jgi:hypothetical protein
LGVDKLGVYDYDLMQLKIDEIIDYGDAENANMTNVV